MVRFSGFIAVLAAATALAFPARAQTSDTWLLNPPGGDYNSSNNWASNTVPDNGGTATFGNTAIRTITISSDVSPGGFTFNSGAPAYTITLGSALTFTGAGIVNNSGGTQTLDVGSEMITFSNSSSAGSSLTLNASGSINFFDSSSAGSAQINMSGIGAALSFDDSATAGSATITVSGGAFMCFCNDATAGTANITVTGTGSILQFENNTAAGNATITAGTGGTVQFLVDGITSSARYIGAGGTLDVSSLGTIGLGSIEGSGTVDLGAAALTVGNNNLSTVYTGVISGTGGSLTKTGTGTLTLGGANTYDGGTTVSGGTLEGTTTSLQGAIVDNANVTFNQSGNGAYNGALSGIGTVTIAGSGVVTFGGTNSYAGSTFLNGGTLSVSSDANLGNGGSLIFNGGALNASTSFSTARTATLNAGGGTLDVNSGQTLTMSGAIDGTGALTKSGAGILKLIGTNTYSGGTTINAGTLQLGQALSIGSITGAVVNNTTFQTILADISGVTMITTNSGATTTFSDATTSMTRLITNAGGTFNLQASSVTVGSIEGAGTYNLGVGNLTVGGNGLSTIASGTITGGSLTKVGSGTLTLSGADSVNLLVNAGGVMLTNTLTGNATVASGATLGGTGSIVGNVTNSGTIAPTNFSTLAFTGFYTQNSGGTLQIAVNGAGQNGKLAVTGQAILGGALSVQAVAGTYARNTSYTIFTASNTFTGTFSSVSSNLAFLTPSLTYSTTDVTLNLLQSSNAFSSGAQTGNQRAVGAVLDQAGPTATGDFANVLNAIVALDTAQGPRVLDAIGGQNYAGFSTAAVQSATAFMNAFASQVGGGNGGNNGRVALAPESSVLDGACDIVCDFGLPRWGVWGGGIGGAGTVAGDQNSHGTSYNFGGAVAGLDYRFSEKFLAGVTAGYTAANLYTQGMDGTGHSGTVQLGLYGQFTEGQIYVDGLAGYARGQNQMQRPIVIPGLQPRTASGQTTVDQFFGQLETGYKVELGGTARAFVTPFARLQASTATQAGFTETGADSLDLTVAGQTTNSLRTVLGAVLGGNIGKATTKFRLGWSHEFADTSRPVTASFAGAPALAFTTNGAAAPRDGVVLGLSVDAPLAEQTSLYARYDGDLEGGNTSHVFSAGVRYVW